MDSSDIWKQTAIRATISFQPSNAVPAGAHIRRYFIDTIPKGKQFDYSQPAVQGVQYCDRLFWIEDSINKHHPGDYEKRGQLCLEKEKPIFKAFWSWLDCQHPKGIS